MKKRRKGRVDKFEKSAVETDRQICRKELTELPEKKVTVKKKKVKYNQGRLILTAVVIALIAVVVMSVKTVFDLRAEQKALKEANRNLTSEKATLKEELKNVNDKEYIEEQARIQLKLIRPGEILYILDEQKKDKKAEEDRDEEDH